MRPEIDQAFDLRSVDTFQIPGRQGLVYTFEGLPGVNPRIFMGMCGYIDGKPMRVTGVETHAVPDKGVIGKSFGLLAEETE